MGIVGWRGDGECSRTLDIGVTQLIRKNLQIVILEVAIVIQHMVMSWLAGTLATGMAQEIPIKFGWMTNLGIDNCPSWGVFALPSLIPWILGEKSNVFALLNNDERDLGFVILVQLATCLLRNEKENMELIILYEYCKA